MSSIDPLILTCVGYYSYVSKEDVMSMPFMGYDAWALHGIFTMKEPQYKG